MGGRYKGLTIQRLSISCRRLGRGWKLLVTGSGGGVFVEIGVSVVRRFGLVVGSFVQGLTVLVLQAGLRIGQVNWGLGLAADGHGELEGVCKGGTRGTTDFLFFRFQFLDDRFEHFSFDVS